jgi:alkaline phosphatase D
MRRLAAVLALAAAFAVAPAASAAELPLTRIAFGSCADQREPQPIWDAVLAYRPELFLFAGDNVYGDVPNAPDLKALQAAYAQTKVIDGLQRPAPRGPRTSPPGTTTTSARTTAAPSSG